jgi:exonuclease III
VQEVGDPSLLSSRFNNYFLVVAPGPSQQEGGVGLLIANYLQPCCRSYKRSPSGRLIGVVLELSKGQQTLIISAYMPTGLDRHSPHSDAALLAHELYTESMKWATGIHQVVLMGDLNETLTALDRLPAGAGTPVSTSHGAVPSPIQCLPIEGFTDAYRALYPNALHTPGFTHAYDTIARAFRSRIDYIWTRGFTAHAHMSIHIDTKLHRLHSHHHLLWMELGLTVHASCTADDVATHQLRIPNLRSVTQEKP